MLCNQSNEAKLFQMRLVREIYNFTVLVGAATDCASSSGGTAASVAGGVA